MSNTGRVKKNPVFSTLMANDSSFPLHGGQPHLIPLPCILPIDVAILEAAKKRKKEKRNNSIKRRCYF